MKLIDYRVLYQYNNPPHDGEGDVVRPSFGPTFGFTTILAVDPDSAADEITRIHSNDQSFSVVQVVEANDFETGFPS